MFLEEAAMQEMTHDTEALLRDVHSGCHVFMASFITAPLTDVWDFLLDRGGLTLAETHISAHFTCWNSDLLPPGKHVCITPLYVRWHNEGFYSLHYVHIETEQVRVVCESQ